MAAFVTREKAVVDNTIKLANDSEYFQNIFYTVNYFYDVYTSWKQLLVNSNAILTENSFFLKQKNGSL